MSRARIKVMSKLYSCVRPRQHETLRKNFQISGTFHLVQAHTSDDRLSHSEWHSEVRTTTNSRSSVLFEVCFGDIQWLLEVARLWKAGRECYVSLDAITIGRSADASKTPNTCISVFRMMQSIRVVLKLALD